MENHLPQIQERSKHSLTHIPDNTLDDDVVIWEMESPETELPMFLSVEYNQDTDREMFIQELKGFLKPIPPYNDDHNQFWEWLQMEATDSDVADICNGLAEKLSSPKVLEQPAQQFQE